MSKVEMNPIIELILSFWLLISWRLGSYFIRLAGDFEVVLYYTISKLRDSAEAYRLLALPLSSPLTATVESLLPGSAWSKAAERVDQRREIAYRNKSKLADRSQRRPE